MKKRVKMLDSIAGLADVSQAQLDRKYAQIMAGLESQSKSPAFVEDAIRAEKKKDQAAPRTGFVKDWSFKPGDEPLIDAKLAEKWEEAGLCVVIQEKAAA